MGRLIPVLPVPLVATRAAAPAAGERMSEFEIKAAVGRARGAASRRAARACTCRAATGTTPSAPACAC
ncbi:MAG: hypothetical protein MZW92_35855 [Comamonadaceae bacterium]|nr:hypothetical protein [Comamonadaceae bacterium]